MVFFDTIANFFGNFWNLGTDLLLLIFVIIYVIIFFIVQYYLIKGYIWLFNSTIMKIPFIRDFFENKNNKNINNNEN